MLPIKLPCNNIAAIAAGGLLLATCSMSPVVDAQNCTSDLLSTCSICFQEEKFQDKTASSSKDYDCSLPGLQDFQPGFYEGIKANYLSFVTEISAPNLPRRAVEFEQCTGGKIVFSEAANVWEDPVFDLGTKTSRGSEVYDGYFMSYSHFPEVSALDLAEHLNDRIRNDNGRLKWEDVLPKVKAMGEYRKNGVTNIDFLMYDGDFFVPIIRIDLLEKYNLPLPNTWQEVVKLAIFFNGTDLNDDGVEDDFGFCHFPRLGAGNWDWWFSEAIYSTWATTDQVSGIQQGFFFNEDTMEPRLDSPGFRRAVKIWKKLWNHGSNCEKDMFINGRCAIGFGPPGCWKKVMLHGVSRKDEHGTVIWRPTLQNGEYAEPYRFKPFGSTHVVDRTTNQIVQCSRKLCPMAEVIPSRGHHYDGDRASILTPSPLAGQLINRAPFYWSGGVGTLIRKSAPERKKDLMWDFFVYTNSPDTSVYDVANYDSWLDSWRFSQLLSNDTFIEAGWSQDAYDEHTAIMQWALSNNANGAFNLRLPGLAKYTRHVVGENVRKFIAGTMSIDDLVNETMIGWTEITDQENKLDQLEIYRSSLGLDLHSEVELCRLHRDLVDEKDPSICRKFDPILSNDKLLLATLLPMSILLIVMFIYLCYDRKRRANALVWKIKPSELHFSEPPRVLGRGTFGVVLLAEYRGTQAAVKRVIPPKTRSAHDTYVEDQADPMCTSQLNRFFDRYDFPQNSTLSSDAEAPPEVAMGDISAAAIGKVSSSSFGTGVKRNRLSWLERPKFLFDGNNGANWLDWLTNGNDYSRLKEDFISEIKQLSKLRHQNILTIMGAVVAKNAEPMLVTEYMDHGSLYDVLQNHTMLIDGEILLPILRDIVQGVRYLHASTPQIVHCDLKASNILVDGRFRAKVADFGLSQKVKVGAAGTPYFLAPEVLRGESCNTCESDSYAFGMIIYEAYSRRYPYEGEDYDEVIRLVADRHVSKRPPIPRTCPPKAQTLMSECLCSDPLQRPTFEELDLALKRSKVSTMEPLGMPEKKHKRRSRSDDLLYEVFPKHVAEALQEGRKVEPQSRDMVTIFFSDIVGFTEIAASLTPLKVADMLDRLYTKFDTLCRSHDVFKVETIGDAYMAVTGLIKDQADHAKLISVFAIAAINAANNTLIDVEDPSKGCVDLRVGFSSGPVVANVVGTLNPRYCLFGDVVNTSARMESTSMPNRIHCSELSSLLLREQWPGVSLEPRGLINIKGKGEMSTFFVNGELDGYTSHSVGLPVLQDDTDDETVSV